MLVWGPTPKKNL